MLGTLQLAWSPLLLISAICLMGKIDGQTGKGVSERDLENRGMSFLSLVPIMVEGCLIEPVFSSLHFLPLWSWLWWSDRLVSKFTRYKKDLTEKFKVNHSSWPRYQSEEVRLNISWKECPNSTELVDLSESVSNTEVGHCVKTIDRPQTRTHFAVVNEAFLTHLSSSNVFSLPLLNTMWWDGSHVDGWQVIPELRNHPPPWLGVYLPPCAVAVTGRARCALGLV